MNENIDFFILTPKKDKSDMEDIRRKAHFDELNKSKDEIGSSPRKYIGVPHPVRCVECGRLVDANEDKGHMIHNGYICKQCLR